MGGRGRERRERRAVRANLEQFYILVSQLLRRSHDHKRTHHMTYHR